MKGLTLSPAAAVNVYAGADFRWPTPAAPAIAVRRSHSRRESRLGIGVTLVGNRIAVAPWIGGGETIAGCRIDHHRCRTSRHSECGQAGHVMTARLELVVDRIRYTLFNCKLVEAWTVRPERAVEMRRLHARALERLVQVRVPVAPEFDDAEKRLQNGLLLIVPAWGSKRHHRRVALEDETRRQRVPWSRARANLIRAGLVEPELLAAHAHADAGVAENHGAGDPAAARRGIEEIAVAVDDRDVRGVLGDAAR